MVFFEIAVEPAAIQTYRDLQLVLSHIGFGKGRLLADFPSAGPNKDLKHDNWAWQIVQSVKRAEIGKAPQVQELLIRERRKILRSRRGYDHSAPWLENARSEHSSKPFGAIITEGPVEGDFECHLDDLLEVNCPVCLKNDQHVRPLPKTPDAFAAALVPMLAYSRELRFVDPYFLKRDSAGNLRVSPKHGKVVEEIAKRLNEMKRGPQLIEFHLLMVRGLEDPEVQLNVFANEMVGYLPKSWKFNVCLWSEKLSGRKFHARYVLTDVGGVGSDYGLDQGNSPSDVTDLYLLPDPVRVGLIEDFSAQGEAFQLEAGSGPFSGIRG
jgi:hypothetical protein